MQSLPINQNNYRHTMQIRVEGETKQEIILGSRNEGGIDIRRTRGAHLQMVKWFAFHSWNAARPMGPCVRGPILTARQQLAGEVGKGGLFPEERGREASKAKGMASQNGRQIEEIKSRICTIIIQAWKIYSGAAPNSTGIRFYRHERLGVPSLYTGAQKSV